MIHKVRNMDYLDSNTKDLEYMRKFCLWSLKYETDIHRIEQVLDICQQKEHDGMLHEEEPPLYGVGSPIESQRKKAEVLLREDRDAITLGQLYDIFYQAFLSENKYPETEEEWERLIEESEREEAEGRGLPHEEVVKMIDAMFA